MSCHNEPFGCGSGGGGGPRDPFVPIQSVTTPVLSVVWDDGPFKNGDDAFVPMLAWRTGWTITVNSAVSEFSLTGSWSDMS